MLSSLKILSLLAASASCQRFLFSFGDSYTTTYFDVSSTKPSTDNPIGNPPYPGYTTCNGPNWVDVFTTHVPVILTYNFAVAGAATNNSVTFPQGSTTPDFITQRELFSANLVPAPSYAQWNSLNSIFAIWFGINDVYNTYLEGNTVLSPNPQSFQTYTNELETLYAAGARRFVLFTVPPFTQTPLFMTLPNSLTAVLAAQDISSWNSELNTTAANFRSAHPDVRVRTLVTNPLFQRILDNPTKYGAPNNSCNNTDGTSCLWWDTFHPGQAIQKALGLKMYRNAKKLGFFE